MTRATDNLSPTAGAYSWWLRARESQYHACCQRTAAHRFDCSVVTPERRERGPLRRAR